MKLFVLILLLFAGAQNILYSQNWRDSTFNKNSIKVDIVPLYYDFFDTRMQIRAGIEYEKEINTEFFAACFMDMGLFDKYIYKKYYDFFNQHQGMYCIEQKVSILGFHIMPSINYYVLGPKKLKKQTVYGGGIIDINYYRKKFKILNTNTQIETSNKFNQYRLGLGLDLGTQYNISSHFFVELKTAVFAKIFNVVSDKDMNQIKPLNAQWSDSDNKFWWVSNFMIGYVF